MISLVSIYLTSKIQEETIRLRDLINISYRYIHPDGGPPEIGKEYDVIKNDIIKCEFIVSKTLDYQFTYEHPYKYLVHFLNLIYDWSEQKSFYNSKIAAIASILLSDSDFTTIPLKYSAPAQAAISIYIAFQICGLKLPFIKDCFTVCNIFCPGLPEEQFKSA
ncbi:hypothetical protein HZS_6042, partial [Henneguya salminicola]